MSNLTARIADITSEHARARATAGVTGRTITRGLTRGMPSRLAAESITRVERERDARRMSERERHAEAARLARRMRTIADAQAHAEQAGDVERAARLGLLYGDVESARERYVNRTFQAVSVPEDWQRGGRFARYARRYDLGFIGYTSEDILQDAAELLAAGGLMTSDRMPTIGDAYRALKHAYRRGLGFYGYERRGKMVERDLSERGYAIVDSTTVEHIRMRAQGDAVIVRRLVTGDDFSTFVDETPATAEYLSDAERAAELAPLAERRRRALGTLANRFPLNADGRMLALATLLTEGYTIEELTEGLGVTERTLDAWADQLGSLTGDDSTPQVAIDQRDAFEVVDDLVDALA